MHNVLFTVYNGLAIIKTCWNTWISVYSK